FKLRLDSGRPFIWTLDYSRVHAALPAPCSQGESSAGRGLALGKDFAVSLPPSYPYSGTGPSTLGWGPPRPFERGRHCSHLSACAVRPLAATFLSSTTRFAGGTGECPDFPLSTMVPCYADYC